MTGILSMLLSMAFDTNGCCHDAAPSVPQLPFDRHTQCVTHKRELDVFALFADGGSRFRWGFPCCVCCPHCASDSDEFRERERRELPPQLAGIYSPDDWARFLAEGTRVLSSTSLPECPCFCCVHSIFMCSIFGCCMPARRYNLQNRWLAAENARLAAVGQALVWAKGPTLVRYR